MFGRAFPQSLVKVQAHLGRSGPRSLSRGPGNHLTMFDLDPIFMQCGVEDGFSAHASLLFTLVLGALMSHMSAARVCRPLGLSPEGALWPFLDRVGVPLRSAGLAQHGPPRNPPENCLAGLGAQVRNLKLQPP